MSTTSFGERLRTMRRTAKMSQQALAERAGMTQSGLIKLELGTRDPSWETVQKLAAALGVSCEAFNESAAMPDALPVADHEAGRPRKAEPVAAPTKPTSASKAKGKRIKKGIE